MLTHAASQRARVDTEQIGGFAFTFESPVKPPERRHNLGAFELCERLPVIRCHLAAVLFDEVVEQQRDLAYRRVHPPSAMITLTRPVPNATMMTPALQVP